MEFSCSQKNFVNAGSVPSNMVQAMIQASGTMLLQSLAEFHRLSYCRLPFGAREASYSPIKARKNPRSTPRRRAKS